MEDYKIKRDIAELAIKNGGCVYGGFVRDTIAHDDAARKFYAAHKDGQGYDDPCVSPETIDRLLVPSDVDCHFTSMEQYKKFKSELGLSHYRISRQNRSRIYVNPELEEGEIVHYTFKVHVPLTTDHIISYVKKHLPSCVASNLAKKINIAIDVSLPPVKVDVVISQRAAPFGDLDFACNGLVMNERGVEICQELGTGLSPMGKYNTLMQITEDILKKRAVVCHLKPARWDKMEKKGWDLIGENVTKVKSQGETCLFCHVDIKDDDVYKFSCCSAAYDSACFSTAMTHPVQGVFNTRRCPHCRQDIYMTEEERSAFS